MGKKAKHTPAPWKAINLDGKYFPSVIIGNRTGLKYSDGSGDNEIARLVVNVGLDPDDIERGVLSNTMQACQANALLIAASPNLFAVCEAALKDYDNINHPTDAHQKVMAQLREAINLAKGGDDEDDNNHGQ